MNVRFCDTQLTDIKTIFNTCSDIEILNVTNKLGAGHFGDVYSVLCKYNDEDMDAALKIEKTICKPQEYEKLCSLRNIQVYIDAVKEAADVSFVMGENNLGPRVYDSFYSIHDISENEKHILHYTLMDNMDANCLQVITDRENKLNRTALEHIAEQTKSIIVLMVFQYNIICTDIKLSNFMYMYDSQNVRMIDFGGKYCDRDIDDVVQRYTQYSLDTGNDYIIPQINEKFVATLMLMALLVLLASSMKNALDNYSTLDNIMIMDIILAPTRDYLYGQDESRYYTIVYSILEFMSNDYFQLGSAMLNYTPIMSEATFTNFLKYLRDPYEKNPKRFIDPNPNELPHW